MNKLDANFSLLESSLRALSRRQEILSSNIANGDTPNYKAKDYDFKRAISDAESQSTNGSKGYLSNVVVARDYVLERNNPYGLDGNNVNLDQERIELAENGIKYESAVSFAQIDIKNLLSVLQG